MRPVEQQVDPDAPELRAPRIEQPPPDDPGDDERDREGRKKDGAKQGFPLEASVEQDGEGEPDPHTPGEEDDGEPDRVEEVDAEPEGLKQIGVGAEPGPRVIGQHIVPPGQGHVPRPSREPVDEDRERGHRWEDHRDARRAICDPGTMAPRPAAPGGYWHTPAFTQAF